MKKNKFILIALTSFCCILVLSCITLCYSKIEHFDNIGTDISWITLINQGYMDYTINFLRHLKKNNIVFFLTIYCINMTKEMKQKLENEGNCECIDFNNDALSNDMELYGDTQYKQIVFYKIDAIKETIKKNKGYYTGYIDMDIILFRDPSKTILDKFAENDNISVVCQCDEPEAECSNFVMCKGICTGVICFKNSSFNKNLGIFSYDVEDINKFSSDQEFLQARLNINHIQYRTVSKTVFMNGSAPIKLSSNEKYSIPSTADLLHFNYLVGDQKREKMILYNYWLI
jgi:hypothetical protein